MRVQGLGFSIWRYTPIAVRGLANYLGVIHKDIRILALSLGRIGIYIMWYTKPEKDSEPVGRGGNNSIQ